MPATFPPRPPVIGCAAAPWDHDRHTQTARPGFDLDGFEDEPVRTPIASMVVSLAVLCGAGALLLTIVHLIGVR